MDCFLSTSGWIVDICDSFVVLPFVSLAVMSFEVISGSIFGMACLARCMFAPGSAISSVCLLGELGGVPIFIKK